MMDRLKLAAWLRAWDPPIARPCVRPAAELLETSVTQEWCLYMDADVSKASDPLKISANI